MEIEFTDRYRATGRSYPRQLMVCHGQCEGMGCYPVRGHDPAPSYYDQYPHMAGMLVAGNDLTEAEAREVERIRRTEGEAEDGWYFIPCGDCGGKGRIPAWRGIPRIPGIIRRALHFWWFAIRNRPEHWSHRRNFVEVTRITLGLHSR